MQTTLYLGERTRTLSSCLEGFMAVSRWSCGCLHPWEGHEKVRMCSDLVLESSAGGWQVGMRQRWVSDG